MNTSDVKRLKLSEDLEIDGAIEGIYSEYDTTASDLEFLFSDDEDQGAKGKVKGNGNGKEAIVLSDDHNSILLVFTPFHEKWSPIYENQTTLS